MRLIARTHARSIDPNLLNSNALNALNKDLRLLPLRKPFRAINALLHISNILFLYTLLKSQHLCSFAKV